MSLSVFVEWLTETDESSGLEFTSHLYNRYVSDCIDGTQRALRGKALPTSGASSASGHKETES